MVDIRQYLTISGPSNSAVLILVFPTSIARIIVSVSPHSTIRGIPRCRKLFLPCVSGSPEALYAISLAFFSATAAAPVTSAATIISTTALIPTEATM